MTINNNPNTSNTVLVTGANGLIGRWLVPALLDHGYQVIAAMRQSQQREAEFRQWVQQHAKQPVAPEQLSILEFSLEQVGSLFSALDSNQVVAICHLAAAYDWGLSQAYAQKVNVEANDRLLEQAALLPNLKRFLWIGGYRTANTPDVPADQLYRLLGGYEASKTIAHKRLKQQLTASGIPWTALNPASVIGDSVTGESTQVLGMGEMVKQLKQKKLPILPGNANSLVPLVHVDFVAEFAVRALEQEDAINQEYWLLDDNTPTLPRLISRIASHLSVKAPVMRVPTWVLRYVPAFLFPGSKETLSFIAEDRYNIASTRALAQKMGIDQLLPINNLEGWVDCVVEM